MFRAISCCAVPSNWHLETSRPVPSVSDTVSPTPASTSPNNARSCQGVIYSLFLGFGISIGAEMFRQITGREVSNANNYTCSNTHSSDHWWKVTPSEWWCKYLVTLSFRPA
jgi:hypothetical protein